MATSGFASLKASCTPCEIGWTVDDPEIVIWPLSAPAEGDASAEAAGEPPPVLLALGVEPLPEHALATNSAARATAPRRVRFALITR
jgi:hypothetical protein